MIVSPIITQGTQNTDPTSTIPVAPATTVPSTTTTTPVTTATTTTKSTAPVTTTAPTAPASTGSGTGGGKAPAGFEYNGSGQLVPITTAPIMPPSVQTGIETSANSETNALGTGVPTNGATPSTASTSTEPNINDYIGQLTAPTVPDLNADQSAEQTAVGIPAISANINTLTAQLQSAQAQALSDEGNEASKPGVVASVINGRIKMISAEDAVAIDNLNSQIKDANTQLTAANAAVAAYMKNDQSNYTDASDAYEKNYTAGLAQYNDAVTQQDKTQASAKANSTAIIAAYKGSTAGADSITPEETAQWNAIDLQAGLPPGTTQAGVLSGLNITKYIKGSDGNEYALTTDANGVPSIYQIGSVGGKSTGNLTPTEQAAATQKTDLSTMSNAIQSAITQNKASGAKDSYLSPDEWNQALSQWTAKGYDVATFVSNFKGFANTNDTTNNGLYEGL